MKYLFFVFGLLVGAYGFVAEYDLIKYLHGQGY